MAIQASKPNNRVFLILGIVLAALAFGGVLFALKSAGGGNTTTIVVAKLNLAAGTTLTADQVTTASVPVAASPQDAYTSTQQVVGKTTTATVTVNTPIVPAFFAATPLSAATATSASGAPVSVETQLVKGYVALAIPAAPPQPPSNTTGPNSNTNGMSAEQVSAGYYILPGDHIDILIDPGTGGVRYSFQDIIVLRAGVSGAAAGAPSVYIVEVSRSQAEVLTGLMTERGIVKDADGKVTYGPYPIKYVLRPQAEWGKLAPDNSKYAPNYEGATADPLPNAADTTVTPGTLQSLFGK